MISSEWKVAPDAWNVFTARHPELGFRPGRWPFHNFLRSHRPVLVNRGAIRKARNRFWVAHVERFCAVAFDCATGHATSEPVEAQTCPVPTLSLDPSEYLIDAAEQRT